MTVAAFMPVRFFAETPTFSVSPVDKLRWESRATHRNLRRHAHGEWLRFFRSPGSHEGV